MKTVIETIECFTYTLISLFIVAMFTYYLDIDKIWFLMAYFFYGEINDAIKAMDRRRQ